MKRQSHLPAQEVLDVSTEPAAHMMQSPALTEVYPASHDEQLDAPAEDDFPARHAPQSVA